MPPNARSRPTDAGGAAGSDGATTASDLEHTPGSEIAGLIAFDARRRAAACRMPPVGDGPADPLDALGRVPLSLPSSIAARRAWCHLQEHGLLDADGWLADVLAEGVA